MTYNLTLHSSGMPQMRGVLQFYVRSPMAKYKPNVVSLNRRLALAICVVFLLIFALAELATGYTYVLGKRGGYLLSGIPTLMIALSASALCAAAMSMIIDHYDKRENESSYAATRAA